MSAEIRLTLQRRMEGNRMATKGEESERNTETDRHIAQKQDDFKLSCAFMAADHKRIEFKIESCQRLTLRKKAKWQMGRLQKIIKICPFVSRHNLHFKRDEDRSRAR